MMNIPFEPQQDTATAKRCGAAALCMVYRSLGIETSQDEVWPGISRQHTGRAYTYLMAEEALQRGLGALIVKALDPWRILRRAMACQCRVILNHRIEGDRSSGHYSVLVDCDEETVVLHDPRDGPERRLDRTTFLNLWQGSMSREVMGNVLIALGPASSERPPCTACGTPVPDRIKCRCGRVFPLSPSVILGCVADSCRERLWRQLHCPKFDCSIFTVPAEVVAQPEAHA